MSSQLLTQSDLANWCGYKRQGDIERWLRDEGIKFFRVRDGKISTTIGLIEAAKLKKAANQSEVEFE